MNRIDSIGTMKSELVVRARILVEYIESHIEVGRDVNSPEVLKDIELKMLSFAMDTQGDGRPAMLCKLHSSLLHGNENPDSLISSHEMAKVNKMLDVPVDDEHKGMVIGGENAPGKMFFSKWQRVKSLFNKK